MEFIINNWWMILVAIAAIVVIAYVIKIFIDLPSNEQLDKLQEWLLYAVTEAEKELGSGTGQIKLRYVYDMFLAQFPFLADKVPFEGFSVLVDEVLVTFRDLIDTNDKVKNYVEGAKEE